MLPVVGLVDMSNGLDWDINFAEANKTKLMWLHSLPFVHYLLEAHVIAGDAKYLARAHELLTDYLDWQSLAEVNRRRAWADEHAVANRSCTIAAMIFSLQRSDPIDKDLINYYEKVLITHAEYLLNQKNYVLNNHGVMMDQMLLQASRLICNSNLALASSWQKVALERLEHMAIQTFDADGCCTENSSIYHLINLNLFKQIIEFADQNDLSELMKDISSRIAMAEKVAPLFLRDDKSLPMIGDSVGGPSNLLPKEAFQERIGRGFFPNSGIIINEEKTHITIKCGGSTYNHRHVDDTSITVRYSGSDIIVDAGMYNYQSSDAMRQWITSYRAHSGFFVESCSTVDFPYRDRTKLKLPPPDSIARISDYLSDGDYIFAELESHLVPGVSIKREVQIILPNIIILRDQLHSETPQRWRQQYLLHPECSLDVKGHSAIIRRGNVCCEIMQHTSSTVRACEKAWYSERFMVAEETNSLVFSGYSSSVELLTSIRFFGGEKNEYSEIAIKEDEVNLSRKFKLSPRRFVDQDIPAMLWRADSAAISRSGNNSFKCSVIDNHGYLLTHGSGYEKIDTGLSGTLPSNFRFATLEFNINFLPENITLVGPSLIIFFMQYDKSGNRIYNHQYKNTLSSDNNILSEKLELHKDASNWKIALRLHGFIGSISIDSSSIKLSTR